MKSWSRTLGVISIMIAAAGSTAAWAATPQVKAGENHTVILRTNGSLWTCGNNFLGQLGNGATTPIDQPGSTAPVRVGTATDWVEVSGGMYHTVARKADGTLWAWGDNTFGQLGLGTAVSVQTTPAQVGTDTNWKTAIAGDYHTVAMKTDGTLWSWGDSADGTLGTGETYSGIILATPTQIGTATDWVAVTTGHSHTMAVKADGTLWGWGSNGSGQLGDQTNLEGRAPIRIGADTDWASVVTRGEQTAARKKDGKLFTWGSNFDGQLGDGTFINKDLPTKVNDDANWATFASGNTHSVALKNDGTLWTWGDNTKGQCGDGKAEQRITTPKQIGTAKDFIAVEAGEVHTVVMKADGIIFSIGDNTLGQLCNGTTTANAVPGASITPVSGDLDANGDVNVVDAIQALKAVAGVRTPSATELITAPLASSTGVFSITDALLILKKAVDLPVDF